MSAGKRAWGYYHKAASFLADVFKSGRCPSAASTVHVRSAAWLPLSEPSHFRERVVLVGGDAMQLTVEVALFSPSERTCSHRATPRMVAAQTRVRNPSALNGSQEVASTLSKTDLVIWPFATTIRRHQDIGVEPLCPRHSSA